MAPFQAVGSRAFTIDLEDAAPGAYYLLAARNEERRVLKLVVQH